MESDTTTYKAMYEGSMSVIDPASTLPPYVDYSATYYNESIGFDITAAHKLAQDQPTVTVRIPCATLGIDPRARKRITASAPSGNTWRS